MTDREFNVTLELMEAFDPQHCRDDALFLLLKHDLITTEEVDEVVKTHGRNPWPGLKPLFRRAHLDAIARGLVPGRLN